MATCIKKVKIFIRVASPAVLLKHFDTSVNNIYIENKKENKQSLKINHCCRYRSFRRKYVLCIIITIDF